MEIRKALEALTASTFEVCFLNRYLNQSDHLGWHADDSPEMDDARPIGIVSLGVEREIWFAPKGKASGVTKVKLEHGSLCVMAEGMQDAWMHRIPKASFQCGERISLTFRGYVDVS
jgi:alkylated DNA repair dioxygenase AlkB